MIEMIAVFSLGMFCVGYAVGRQFTMYRNYEFNRKLKERIVELEKRGA